MEVLKAFVINGTSFNVEMKKIDDEMLFLAKDIAKILELTNVRMSVASYNDKEKVVSFIDTPGGQQNVIWLTEQGVYRLLLMSRKPIAEPFRNWVYDVIKSIRETGKYSLQQEYEAKFKEHEDNSQQTIQRLLEHAAREQKAVEDRCRSDALELAYHGENRHLVYFAKIRQEPDGRLLVKIGSTKNISYRLPCLRNEFGDAFLLRIFECQCFRSFEEWLQKESTIRTFVYTDPVHNGKVSNGEVFIFTEKELEWALRIASRNVKRFDIKRHMVSVFELQELQELREIRGEIEEEEHIVPCLDDLDLLHVTAQPIIVADTHQYTQSRGKKVQRYSADGKELLMTYPGLADAVRDRVMPNESCCSAMIKEAIKKKTVYKGFRWAFLERALPDDTRQDIGETTASKTVHKGFVAMLSITKDKIMEVFTDQKAAAQARNLKALAAISNAIKRGSLSSGHYWQMWHDCSEELQQSYLANHSLPEPRVLARNKPIEQLHPITGQVVKCYTSIAALQKEMRIARLSLFNALNDHSVLKGYQWRYKQE